MNPIIQYLNSIVALFKDANDPNATEASARIDDERRRSIAVLSAHCPQSKMLLSIEGNLDRLYDLHYYRDSCLTSRQLNEYNSLVWILRISFFKLLAAIPDQETASPLRELMALFENRCPEVLWGERIKILPDGSADILLHVTSYEQFAERLGINPAALKDGVCIY